MVVVTDVLMMMTMGQKQENVRKEEEVGEIEETEEEENANILRHHYLTR